MLDMGDVELNQPHIELIFQLLGMQHPTYAHFRVKDNWWAWAQKAEDSREVVFELSPGFQEKITARIQATGKKSRLPFQPVPG